MNSKTILPAAISTLLLAPTAYGLELYNNGKSALDFKGNLSIY
ncbi:hypothetical protein [Litorilituus sediminis]|nr:hypothetical protein [Litorilituus sediminis]